jgi:hypothetical protein
MFSSISVVYCSRDGQMDSGILWNSTQDQQLVWDWFDSILASWLFKYLPRARGSYLLSGVHIPSTPSEGGYRTLSARFYHLPSLLSNQEEDGEDCVCCWIDGGKLALLQPPSHVFIYARVWRAPISIHEFHKSWFEGISFVCWRLQHWLRRLSP